MAPLFAAYAGKKAIYAGLQLRLNPKSKTGFYGVEEKVDSQGTIKYVARILVEGKQKHIGVYNDAQEAAAEVAVLSSDKKIKEKMTPSTGRNNGEQGHCDLNLASALLRLRTR